MQTTSVKPLSGLRIVVTRPKSKAGTLSEALRSMGAVTIELPTIEIASAGDCMALDAAIGRLEEYDWVVFTSVHGVEFFLNRMATLNVPFDMFKSRQVAAIGPNTGRALMASGKKPDYIPDHFLSKRIADGLGDVNGKRLLLPRADIASDALPAILRSKGGVVDEVVVYRTIIPFELTAEKVRRVFEEGVDLITFTSPSTIRYLSQVLGENELSTMLRGTRVACIGPVTAEAAGEVGLAVDIAARTHTVEGLIEAIVHDRTR